MKIAFLYNLEDYLYGTNLEINDCICLLRKSLYVTKQTLKKWNKKISEFIYKYALIQFKTVYDACMYYLISETLIISLSVIDAYIRKAKTICVTHIYVH